MYEPRQRNVFVSGVSEDNDDRPTYFEQFNLNQGQLKPSCCTTNDISLTCPKLYTTDITILVMPVEY